MTKAEKNTIIAHILGLHGSIACADVTEDTVAPLAEALDALMRTVRMMYDQTDIAAQCREAGGFWVERK